MVELSIKNDECDEHSESSTTYEEQFVGGIPVIGRIEDLTSVRWSCERNMRG